MRALLLACFCLSCVSPAFAQGDAGVERTPDGRPDLQGVWATRFITRLERPAIAATLEVSADEAKKIVEDMRSRSSAVTDPDFAFYGFDQLAQVNGKFRTSQMVDPPDGKIPYTQAGIDLAEAFDMRESYGFDDPEDRPPYERCLAGILAPPIRTLPMLIPIQIVQTPDAVVFTNEDVQGLRIVPINAKPWPAVVQPFDGVGRGRWEDDTLVIETTGFRPDDIARPDFGPPIILTETTLITERFTRTSHDALLYQYTVEDTHLYTQPWSAEFVMTLEPDGVVHEYACHEANHSLGNMLLAGRLGRQSKPDPK